MPELPEVETIVRGLRRHVRWSTIKRATVVKPDLIVGDPAEFEDAIAGRTIVDIARRAKNIVVDIGEDRLIVNLGMTGRLLVRAGEELEPPYVGVRFELDDGRRLLYHDVRRFGRLEIMSSADWEGRSARLGMEPLAPEFTVEALLRLASQSKVAIKTWLMDQKRIVGVGNIYASEALFRAKLSPRKAALRLTRREATALHDAVRTVLEESIDSRGTTLLDYRDADGEQGEFASRLRVYDREGEPCVVCGSKIRRIVQGGRSTFFCSKCQR
jgi:formamidopyrimidine-DNA glycosylase